MNRSLVLIKPDGVSRNLSGDILKRFEDRGLKVIAMKMMTADNELLTKHYKSDNRNYVLTLGHTEIEGKTDEELEQIYAKNLNIINKLQEFMASGPIVKMVLEGDDNTVSLVREIVGKTNPAAADKGTIRGDLGEDSYEAADAEKRAVRNLVHASGTNEEASEEISLWFPSL